MKSLLFYFIKFKKDGIILFKKYLNNYVIKNLN